MRCSAIALILMVAFCGGSAMAQTATIKPRDPNRWEQSIRDFERSDRTNPPPKNAVLFVGSSSIRIWNTLSQDFPEYKVINRGFGGSEIEDSVKYANRIVLPYRPKAIVFYAGDNDLHAGKAPQELFQHFKLFAFKVHEVLPKTKIIVISVKPSPAYWHSVEKVMKTNALIEDYCDKDERLVFVNVFPKMLGADGRPKPELYKKDGVHLSSEGYQLWTSMVRPHLERVEFFPRRPSSERGTMSFGREVR
ncbi:MAG: SGNH/GDSL hydrolase family protein [Limisphaerales bacterium]